VRASSDLLSQVVVMLVPQVLYSCCEGPNKLSVLGADAGASLRYLLFGVQMML
jgi:hypothetical protein